MTDVMRALVFAAKIRGAETFEEALDWMLREQYLVAGEDGEFYPTAKGVQRAENIMNPRRMGASDHRALYGWARALRSAQLDGEDVPDFADTDAVVGWLATHDHLGDVSRKQCREIVAAGLLAYAPQTA